MSTDRTEAKAEAAAAKARAKAMRPWWRRKRVLIPAGFVALLALGAAFSGSAEDEPTASPDGVRSQSGNTDNPPAGDVTMTSCAVDGPAQFQSLKSGLEITNNSSKTSTYSVTVVFSNGAGLRVGDSLAFVNDLAPDETTVEEVVDFPTDGVDLTGLTCKVTEVDRYAS